jgi:hypothetical protein
MTTGMRPPVYPMLLAAAYLVQFFGTTSSAAQWLWRPLVVAVALVAAVYLILSLATHRVAAAALLSGALVLVVMDAVLLAILVLAAVALIWQARRMWPRLPAPTAQTASRAGDTVAVVLLAIVTYQAAPLLLPEPAPRARPAAYDASSARPNMYLILLDGYARADTLARFGLDNRPFLGELEDRGFHVATRAQSSYRITKTTMVSMLYMAQVVDLKLHLPERRDDEARLLRRMVNDSPAIATFEALGYYTISIPPGVAMVDVRNTDEVIEHGYLNEFEQGLIERSLLDDLLGTVTPDLLPDLWRQRIDQAFADVQSVAERRLTAPTLLYAHIMAPHAPFVFAATGGASRPDCELEHCRWFAGTMPDLGIDKSSITAAYTAQVEAVNAKVIPAVDAIISNDPDAVILLFGDHGSRVDPADLDEWYRPLFAARTPGRDVFGDKVGPTQIFAGLLADYFRAEVTIPRVERFVELRPLTVEPYQGGPSEP